MNASLHCGIYVFEDGGESGDRRELWESLEGAVIRHAPGSYRPSCPRPFNLLVLKEVTASPDNKYFRFRTIEANVRRKRGYPTLLELGLGNHFAEAGDQHLPAPPDILHDPRYAKWVRAAGAISLANHLRLCGHFVGQLRSAGRKVVADDVKACIIRPVEIENAAKQPLPFGSKLAPLFRDPAVLPSRELDFLVVHKSAQVASDAARHVEGAFVGLMGEKIARLLPSVRVSTRVDRGCVNLILLNEQLDLTRSGAWLCGLQAEEEAGTRFKLSKVGSLCKSYPARNIAADLFNLSGGCAWHPTKPLESICAMDAGHEHDGRSRWAKVESTPGGSISQVLVRHTGLAEHIPAQILSELWPTGADAILCRDGRLSQERNTIQSRARRESRAIIEVKKSPKPILWRMLGDDPLPAALGDAVIDSHGDVLLQTIDSPPADYIRPVRLTAQGGDAISLAASFLDQHAIPSLTLFNLPRLPGALYYADLVSKFTKDGWPKAIGRGFRVPLIVPAPLAG
jgi:hypothetical protein